MRMRPSLHGGTLQVTNPLTPSRHSRPEPSLPSIPIPGGGRRNAVTPPTLTANPVPSGPRLAGGVDGASGLSAPALPCPIAAE